MVEVLHVRLERAGHFAAGSPALFVQLRHIGVIPASLGRTVHLLVGLVREIGRPVGNERFVALCCGEFQQMLQLQIGPEVFRRGRHALAIADETRMPIPRDAIHVVPVRRPMILPRSVVSRPIPRNQPVLRPQHARIGTIPGVLFADHAGGITSLLHHLEDRQMPQIFPKRDFRAHRVLIVAGVVRVFSGHHHGARWRAHGRGPRIPEKDTVVGQLLQIGHVN